MKKPIISIIVAISKNRAIGKNNQLLFDIPEDLTHFRKKTNGHPVIMGEKTYLSIGHPLPNRTNIILSRKELEIPDCIVCHSIQDAIRIASEKDKEEIFFIGGGMVYKEALLLAHKLYLTLVDEVVQDADVFFPEYKQIFKKVISEEKHYNGQYKYSFIELER